MKEYSSRIDTREDEIVTQRVAVVGRTAYTLKRELCYMSTAVYESCGSVIGVIKTLHWILMIGTLRALRSLVSAKLRGNAEQFAEIQEFRNAETQARTLANEVGRRVYFSVDHRLLVTETSGRIR